MKVLLIVQESIFVQNINQEFELNYKNNYKYNTIIENSVDTEYILDNLNEYDCIFLDLVFPKMDGLKLLECIMVKNNKANVVVMSSNISDFEKAKAIELGAKYVFQKPISCQRLIEIANEINIYNKQLLVNEETEIYKEKSQDVDPNKLIENILLLYGFDGSMNGYDYLKKAILRKLNSHNKIVSVTKTIYPELAKYFNTSAKCVERSIRSLIEKACIHGNIERLNKTFNMKVNMYQKPTNSQVIDKLARIISNKLKI